jgi:hypothetical protein
MSKGEYEYAKLDFESKDSSDYGTMPAIPSSTYTDIQLPDQPGGNPYMTPGQVAKTAPKRDRIDYYGVPMDVDTQGGEYRALPAEGTSRDPAASNWIELQELDDSSDRYSAVEL